MDGAYEMSKSRNDTSMQITMDTPATALLDIAVSANTGNLFLATFTINPIIPLTDGETL